MCRLSSVHTYLNIAVVVDSEDVRIVGCQPVALNSIRPNGAKLELIIRSNPDATSNCIHDLRRHWYGGVIGDGRSYELQVEIKWSFLDMNNYQNSTKKNYICR